MASVSVTLPAPGDEHVSASIPAIITAQPLGRKKISAIFFDLDNTLYPKSSGLSDEVARRIGMYMSEHLQFSSADADKARANYYKTYGLTLTGLMIDHKVDVHHYLDFVHGGVDLPKFLKQDLKLREMLLRIPKHITKWIFSNADLGHCQRVMKLLGIEDLMDGILDYLIMKEESKPRPQAYHSALRMAATGADTLTFEETLFLDDSLDNLIAAKALGMQTVLVGSKTDNPAVDYCVADITDIVQVMPFLFDEPQDKM